MKDADNDEVLLTPIEQLQERHRKEKKDLAAKITTLRYSVPKNDKKRKKEIAAEIEKLEKELKERQEKELSLLEVSEKIMVACTAEQNSEFVDSLEAENQPRISKAVKRREKKAEVQRRLNEAAEKDAEASKFAPGRLENEAISACLSSRNLRLYEIPPNGDCLYNAISHQLSFYPEGSISQSGKDVRRKAAAYIHTHKEDFLPFLTWEDGSPIDEFDFEAYCGKVEKSCNEGGQWGGEPELRALSNVLERRIEVLQPEGRVVVFGDQYSVKKPLVITYHRHAYSLGEHYNSTETM